MKRDLATLLVRGTVGGFLAGHGAQKLFGAFGGPGPDRFGAFLEQLGLRPGRPWAILAGVSEFGGGVLTALGALNPVGPVMAMGSMLMATLTVHEGKPVWVSSGGAELPLTNLAVQGGLILGGPGALSVDGLLGIRTPRWFTIATLFAMVGGLIFGLRIRARQDELQSASSGTIAIDSDNAGQPAEAPVRQGREKVTA
jgi:putative oxidoreductase